LSAALVRPAAERFNSRLDEPEEQCHGNQTDHLPDDRRHRTSVRVELRADCDAARPVRAAGHTLTAHVVKEWAPEETFAEDPPNATISVFTKDGTGIRDAVVVLKSAKLDGERLTFEVDVLERELTGGDGPASLFIDRFGFGGFRGGGFAVRGGGFERGGFARGGYARVGAVGVWHRPYVAGGAWYRGAAVGVGAAAVGAAAAAYSGACGYYPNPPCY
jgi:hypothetical protein